MFLGLAANARPAAAVAAQAPSVAKRCRAGTFDYGTGMVAARLSEAVERALERAHAQALAAVNSAPVSALAKQPYVPHVSVSYGVTDARRHAIGLALERSLAAASGGSACLGDLQYWDDVPGNKTTLVVEVDDREQMLASLHHALAVAAEVRPRFAFHPHITVARLSAQRGDVEPWLARTAALLSPAEVQSAFLLFESRLGRNGASYEAIEHYPLTG